MTADLMVPVDAVVARCKRHLREVDHLSDLLARVEAGHRLTNRLDEALLLIPRELLDEIRESLGMVTEEGGRS